MTLQKVPDDCQIKLTELSIKTKEKLFIDPYKPPSQNHKYFVFAYLE